jgi:hypothetical protein
VIFDIHAGDDLYGRLQMLQAGDEVVVHAGTYTSPGFVQVTWPGTAASPIVVHAAPGEKVVLQGTFAQNLLNIDGSYWTLQGFEITGASHGLRLHQVDHATIQDNVIHDVGDVGISCNFEPDSCDSVSIVHNEIYRTGMDTANAATGEGMYLGCNNAACLFTNGIVANNYVHDTGGAQGDGIEIKTGAYGNDVRDNVIVRSKYPGITMYGFSDVGQINVVERNVVWHTLADNGIQVVGQVLVQNNIVLDSAASGIASKPSQNMTPHDVTIINNTVVGAAGGACLKTNNWATETIQTVADNALYCEGGTAFDLNGGAGPSASILANVGLGTSNAPTGFMLGASTAADLGDPSMGSVYPPTGSSLIGAAYAGLQAIDDFNGTRRLGADVGAYERTTPTNPGWIVTEGFKTLPASASDGPISADDFPIDHPPAKTGCGCHGSDPTSLLVVLTWWSARWRRSRSRAKRCRPPAARPR